MGTSHWYGSTVGAFIAFITALLMIISPLRRLTDNSQPIIGGLIQQLRW